MNSVALLLLTIFFPLNSLLVFQGSFVQGKVEKREDVSQEEKQEIKTAEVVKKPEFMPSRNTDAADLALISAHSSLVLDVDSGTVLHYSNGKERRQIASLTKVMTAVLVMEKIKDLNELVTIDEEAVFVEGTKIGCPRSGYCISQRLKVGEKISAKNLLKAMLMNSANDAATALGKHISGSTEAFVNEMNARAKEMGLEDTHFCTPSGLELEGKESECYSSAYDIARIGAYSLKYDLIWEIFRLPNNTIINSADGHISHTILNTDQVLDVIPNVLGGKTGFTPLAGRSLLMASMDPSKKHKIIAVLLDDPYRWQDIKTLINWTFQSYTWK